MEDHVPEILQRVASVNGHLNEACLSENDRRSIVIQCGHLDPDQECWRAEVLGWTVRLCKECYDDITQYFWPDRMPSGDVMRWIEWGLVLYTKTVRPEPPRYVYLKTRQEYFVPADTGLNVFEAVSLSRCDVAWNP